MKFYFKYFKKFKFFKFLIIYKLLIKNISNKNEVVENERYIDHSLFEPMFLY